MVQVGTEGKVEARVMDFEISVTKKSGVSFAFSVVLHDTRRETEICLHWSLDTLQCNSHGREYYGFG